MDYHFVYTDGGSLPAGAQPNGREADGSPLWVALGPATRVLALTQGSIVGIHPGKFRPSFGAALIPYAGKEVRVNDFQVLMEAGIWAPAKGGGIPRGAIVCGTDVDGEPLFVARAAINGGLHPGKVRFSFGSAYIGFAGLEQHVTDYEVLISQSEGF